MLVYRSVEFLHLCAVLLLWLPRRLGLGDLTPMSSKIELTPKGAMPSMPSPSAKERWESSEKFVAMENLLNNFSLQILAGSFFLKVWFHRSEPFLNERHLLDHIKVESRVLDQMLCMKFVFFFFWGGWNIMVPTGTK